MQTAQPKKPPRTARKNNNPKTVHPILDFMSFYEFMHRSRVKILRVADFPSANFNLPLQRMYSQHPIGEEVSLGLIFLEHVTLQNPFVRQYILNKRKELMWPQEVHIYPGYYLFHHEEAISFHPGEHELNPPEKSWLKKFLSHLKIKKVDPFQRAQEEQSRNIAQGVSALFNPWIVKLSKEMPRTSARNQLQPRSAFQILLEKKILQNARLGEAFQTLGVTEDYTQGDIKRAYRKLARLYHPDQYWNNPKMQKQASQKLRSLNQANTLLTQLLNS